MIAKHTLEDYMKDFEKRNPNMRVFGAYLHMDEETPHLHIDFVPFVTESKRGMDTRVSLKSALGEQGFKGESRGNTEWKQWVESEKVELEKIMNRHGIQWLKKGTHEKYLSVLDYEKRERAKEVKDLEEQLDEQWADFCERQERITKQFEQERFIQKEIAEKKKELDGVQHDIENVKDSLASVQADIVSEKIIQESLHEESNKLKEQKHNLQVDVIGLYEEKYNTVVEELGEDFVETIVERGKVNEWERKYDFGSR